MSHCMLQDGLMKNRANSMDKELKEQIEGLTANQIKLLASIYAGLAERLRQNTVAETLSKWNDRKSNSRN